MSHSRDEAAGINQRGFTYLWVLLITALLGVGLALATEIAVTASQRDKERELLAIGRQFRTAIGRYYEVQMPGGRKVYPATLNDLLHDNRVPGVRRHLRKIFVDPMTGKKEWGLMKVGGRIVGVYSTSEKEPIKQDGFEMEDSALKGKQKYSEWKFTYPASLMLRADGSLIENGNTTGQGFPSADSKPLSPAVSGSVSSDSPVGTVVPLPSLPESTATTPGT